MSKEAIVNQIAKDAKEKCDEIVSAAQGQAARNLEIAKQKAAEREARSLAQPLAEEIARRLKSAAELEVKKTLLAAKQQIIEECFALAKERLESDKNKKEFLLSMIEKEAEEGDEIVLCKNDLSLFDAKEIEKLSAKTGKTLSLSKEAGDFSGGVVLRNGGVEKNLTFTALLQMLRAECEGEAEKILFAKE